jgi:hypothetical protein
MNTPAPVPGKILTFYSYKGGTGRSMAVANIAWLLAHHGKKVLVIDWDLEAPGLHRYFRPFLEDPELSETPGLIDHFCGFMEAARLRTAMGRSEASNEGKAQAEVSAEAWHQPWVALDRNAVVIDHEFPNDGRLEFVGAGRQGSGYGRRVTDFDWISFYEEAGGGVLLEAIKQHLRAEFDYVLIDSRTGLSDTSGICTVQMPDDLVVCFTLNRQSICGAASTAESASRQRRMPSGQPGLKVWPLAMRIDTSEKERLDRARAFARELLSPQLRHLSREERATYWSNAEVPYFPFYAYEEVLATIADRPAQANTLLNSMENVLGEISRHAFKRLRPPMGQEPERQRLELLRRYEVTQPEPVEPVDVSSRKPLVFLSFAFRDWRRGIGALHARLVAALPHVEFFHADLVPAGADLDSFVRSKLEEANLLVLLISPGARSSLGMASEVRFALSTGKIVVPVFTQDIGIEEAAGFWDGLGSEIVRRRGYFFGTEEWMEEVPALIEGITQALSTVSRPLSVAIERTPIDPEDPHKGQWGGASKANGRELTAVVKKITEDWFSIELQVRRIGGEPLTSPVIFHLHPTCDPAKVKVKPVIDRAPLSVSAWGAFTVGVEADEGRTRLELDLSNLKTAPKRFRER